ncbi:uncharacterized protein ACN427_000016 [Glossina fuscipes fuscipes]
MSDTNIVSPSYSPRIGAKPATSIINQMQPNAAVEQLPSTQQQQQQQQLRQQHQQYIIRQPPQQQVSLPTTALYSTGTTNSLTTTAMSSGSNGSTMNKAASCPDSPIRRVSSSLRNSAMGFATRFFNKCRAATFTVDGATYTIGVVNNLALFCSVTVALLLKLHLFYTYIFLRGKNRNWVSFFRTIKRIVLVVAQTLDEIKSAADIVASI